MEAFKQLGLLLKQNLIERKRRWGITLLELGWPIVLLGILVAMRNLYPVKVVDNCKYEPRAMPSSGIFPFMQSYVCNLDAKPKCMADEYDQPAASTSRQRTSALSQIEETLANNGALFAALSESLEKSLPALEQLSATLAEEPEIQEFLNATNDLKAKSLFKDADYLRNELVNSYGLDEELVDTILNSNINISMAVGLLQGVTAQLCDVTDTSTPLTDYLILPANSTSSLTDINEKICNMDNDRVADLVDLLQEQLDPSAVMSLAKDLMSLFTPNAVDVLSDIERMVNVVRSLSSFKGLSEQVPNLAEALKFATQLLSFIRRAADNLPIGPEQITKLVEQLDPLITRWSNNSVVWQDIKRGMYYLSTAMKWLAETLDQLPGMKISFGDLYTDGGQTILDLLNKTTLDYGFLALSISRSEVNVQKMLEWQEALLDGDQYRDDSACELAKLYFESFNYPTDVDKTRLEEAINSTLEWPCKFDPQAFIEELNSKTNFGALVTKLTSNSTIISEDFDWKAAISAGWDLVNVVTRLQQYFEQYADVIQQLIKMDFNKILSGLQHQITSSIQSPSMIYGMMGQLLDYVESILKSTPVWPYVRRQLIYQNLFAELMNDAANLSIEATNITYMYLMQKQTESFMLEFVTLTPIVQQAVVRGLTQPRTVRSMLRDPQQFSSVLCSNMTGLLDLYVDAPTEAKLDKIFCQGNFAMPPGLSEHLVAVGAAIESKVDLLVEAFNNPDSLNSTKYDSVATLAGQLTSNTQLNAMIEKAAQDIILSKSAALRIIMNSTEWNQYWNVVPYAIMATAMDVLGEAMEESDGWSMMAPYHRSIDYTVKHVIRSMGKQEELFSNNRMTGRIIDWVLTYGPEKISLTARATQDPQKMAKVMELLTGGNPLDILQLDCNQTLQDWFYGVGGLDTLPMDQLEADICRPDMTAIAYTELEDVIDPIGYISHVREIFITGDNSSIDWVDMSKSMTDLPKVSVDSSLYLYNHFQSYDWQVWGDLMNELLQSLSSSDSPQMMGMLEQLDIMFGNSTEWLITKHSLNILDIVVVQLSDRYEDIAANGLTLNTLFENATQIKEYIAMNSQFSPAIVEALFDTLIDPTKLFSEVVTGNFTGRVYCQDLFISQFIEFKDPAEAKVVDEVMCGAGSQEFLAALQTDRISLAVTEAVMELTNGLIYNNLTDIDLNYKSMGGHIGEMIQAVIAMQNFTGPYFPELVSMYNMTAMNFRYQAAFERFIQQEPSHWVGLVDDLTKELKDSPDLNEMGLAIKQVWESISASARQNLYGIKIALQQLRELNRVAKDNNGYISLKDLVLPSQLRNVLEALDNAPEMTDTLLYSLIELMSQPQKLSVVQLSPQVLDLMCTNLTVFEYFFTLPPGAAYSIDVMQTSMCSLRINITVLIKEMVEDIDGFSEMLSLYQMNGNSSLLDENLFTDIFNLTTMYSAELAELVSFNYFNNETLKFVLPRWMREDIWLEVVDNIQNYSQSALQQFSQADGYITLVYGLSTAVDQFVMGADMNTKRALATSQAVMEYVLEVFDAYKASGYNDSVVLSGLDELTTINDIYRQIPDFVESLVLTALQYPEKLNAFVRMIIEPPPGSSPVEMFCTRTDDQYKEYFVTPPGNNGGFSKLIELICYTSTDEILGDLRLLPAGSSVYFDNIVNSLNISLEPPPFKSADMINLGTALYASLSDMVAFYQANPYQATMVLQADEWMRVVQNIDSQLRLMENTPFNPNQLLPMLQSIDFNTLSPDLVPYIHTGLAIAKVAIRKLEMFNQTTVDIMDLFKGYPETTKAMQALDMSFDIVELLMTGANSVKLQLLVQLPGDQILPTLCSDDWTEYFSVGPAVDVDAIKSYICTTNWTAVYHELVTDLDIPYIESQLSNNSTVSWTEVINTVTAMSELINDVIALKPTFTYYPWMNETAWNTMMTRAGARVSAQWLSWEYQVQSALASLAQVAPLFEQMMGNDTVARRTIYTINLYLQEYISTTQKLDANGWDITLLFANSTEIKKLLDMMDDLPGYVDIALQTSLQLEKVAPLIRQLIQAGNSSNSLEIFCSVPDLTQYVVYNNYTDLTRLQNFICSGMVDFNVLQYELMTVNADLITAFNVSDEYLMKQRVVGDLILSVSQLVTQINSVMLDDLNAMQNNLPYWLAPAVWEKVFNDFVHSLSTAPPYDVLRILKIQQMLGVEDLLNSVELPQLHVANAVLDVLIEKLELLNRTEVNITTVIQSSPSAVKALDILRYLPDIVEILTASGQTQQFSALFSMGSPESALTALCTNPSAYLSVPPGSAVDLDVVMMEFCANNWTVVVSELMADVNFEHIAAQMNNTSPVNLGETMQRVAKLSELMQSLIVNPPKFIVDSNWNWLNASVWDEVFTRLNSYQLETLVNTISQYFYGVFVPMFGNNPEFQKFGVVLESLLTSLKYELNLWNRPGQNLTVADIIAVNSELGEFVADALDLSPQMYALFLSVSFRNPFDLQILYTSPNPQTLVCNDSSQFWDNLVIPDEVNMVEVKDFICSANFTVILSEIMQRFNIPEIISVVQSNVTTTANWTKIQTDLSDVVNIITQLITNAPNIIPPFDVNEFGRIAMEVTAGIDWQNAEIYLQMTESLIRYFSTQPFWSDIEPYLKISQIVQSWMSEMVSRLEINSDWSINLADLFPNATLLNEYLQASLALDEQTALKLMTGITVKPNKFVELFMPKGDNGSALIDLICNATQFADLFSVPEDMQVTDLSNALCNMISDYGASLVDELQKSLKIDTLISRINKVLNQQSDEVFDVRKSYQMELDLIEKIVSLVNVTDVMYNNIDLREKFALLSNETVFQTYLLNLVQSLPPFELKMVGDALNQMMPVLRSMEWWRESERYFKMMNILSEIGANRVAQLPTVNITLDTLLRDSETLKKLLKDGFAFTPDLIEGLLNAELTISPADLLTANSTAGLQDLLCTAKFPTNVNVTAIKIILCDTDFQKVLDELLVEFDFDLVIIEIGKLDVFSNVTSDFDWNDLLTNTNNLAQNLGIFFTSLKPPPVADFFMYKGNMTAWLERVSKSFQSTMDTGAIFQRLSIALSSLESSLSGRALSDYQQVVIVAQIIQNYLDLAIEELNKYNETVTLSSLLWDKPELVDLVNASAAALPEVLELLLTEPMKSSQLASMLSDPAMNLCTMDLSTLFVESTPADVQSLQNLFCTVNFTEVFKELQEELVMKYYMNPILKPMAGNHSNFDWSAYMGRFVELSQIIEQMIKSPPTISPELLDLVNITEYMKLFDKVQKYWMSQQFALDPNSFAAIMEALNPLLQSSEFGQQMSKFINAADVILSHVNGKLSDIVKSKKISLSSLLGDSTSLKNYLENVFNISPETVATIMVSQPSADVLRLLISGRVDEVCSLDADNILVLPEGASIDMNQVKTIFCDANITTFIAELSSESGISEIIQLLTSNTSMPIEWRRLFNNSQELSTLLAYLATNGTVIDQTLVDAFNFSKFEPIWDMLKQYDPRNLLRLLDAYGPLVEDAAGQSWPVIQSLIYQYSLGLSTSQNVLADLVNSGFTWESLMNNRTALIELFTMLTENNLDQVEDSYVSLYKDQMTALLQRQEIQDILCNETAVRTLIPSLPAYVDLTSLFCGVKDDSWLVELKARNYSILEVAQLDIAISRWYFDKAIDGVYSWEYINSYKTLGNQASLNATLGDLAKPIGELIDVLGSMGAIPPQFFPGFNATYWMPLIDALMKGYVENMPSLVLQTLELMDPLLRDVEFWQQMRTAISAASQYMSWINDKLELLDKQQQPILITQLLPNPEDVKFLLESAMTPEAAAEFLTIHFNPGYLITVLQADPINLFCDVAEFNKSFNFPEGTDVVTIQKTLCEAATNHSLVLNEIWSRFNMTQLIEELARLTGSAKPSAKEVESPFRAALKQFQRLLQNANVITRLVQVFAKGMPDIASYVNTMLTTVNTVLSPDAGNVGSMCDAVMNLIDEIPEYSQAQPYLVRMQVIYAIAAKMATSIDEFDEFLCELPSMNMSTIFNRIADPELLNLFLQVDNEEYLSTTPFVCSRMVRDVMVPQEKIQNMIADAINGSYKVCIDKLTTSNFTLANDVNLYIGILDGLRNLLNADSLTELRPLLEGVLDSLLSQVQASRIGALVNQTAIDDAVNALFNQNGSLITANGFLDTFVDVKQFLALLNRSKSDVENFVCDPKSLNKLILSETGEVSTMSNMLCAHSDQLYQLLETMANNLNMDRLKQLENSMDIQDFISMLVAHLEVLIQEFSELSQIPDLMSSLSNFDLTDLISLLPKVTMWMDSGEKLDIIGDNMIAILDLLETRIPVMADNTVAAMVLNDARLLLNGIRGLKTLRDSLRIDIPMKRILEDPSKVSDFLRANTNMTEGEVSDLLDSYFTSSLLTSSILVNWELKNNLCNETYLRTVLVLPETSTLSYADVGKSICLLDSLQSTNISLLLVKNLQVSSMIANYINDKFGVNTAELKEAAEILAPLQAELSVTIAELTGATAMLFTSDLTVPVSNNDSSRVGQTSALSTASLTDMLCGGTISGYEAEKAVIGDVDISNSGSGGGSSGGAASPFEVPFMGPNMNNVADTETTLKEYQNIVNAFYGASGKNARCDEIKKTIRGQPGGQFVWTYLKPLFIGKILFTPDNEVTRNLTQGANVTFNKLADILVTIREIVVARDLLMNGFNDSDTLDNLKESLSILEDVNPSLIRLLLQTDLDFQGLSAQFELLTSPENQAIISLLADALDFADCISLDRFQGVESEEKLVEMAESLHKTGEFVAGLVFIDDSDSSSRAKRDVSTSIPKHIKYKIRMDIDNVESTLFIQELFYSAAPRDNLVYDMRYMRGFIQIQEMVDRAIARIHGGNNSITQTPTELQLMPATCYNDDTFMGYVYPYLVPLVLTLAWLFAVVHCIKTLTAYRETGLEELMKIMGLKGGVIWWSWFINTYLGMTLLSVITVIFLKVGSVLILSNGFLVFLYILTFSFSTTMFCYMVGSFFTKANVAAAIGLMLYFISYMPYIIYTQFREDYKPPQFHASSLLSPTAFAIGATYISRWEQMGEGLQWSNVDKAPGYNEHGELSVQWMFVWMIIDSVFYFLIGWYIRNIKPGKFGQKLPLYYPFTKSYWGIGQYRQTNMKGKGTTGSAYGWERDSEHSSSLSTKSLKGQADWLTGTDASDVRVFKTAQWLQVSGKDHTDLPVGVSIEKLKKEYDNGKIAVDNLDLVFYEGHVTAFLGRNGAGKTTTINMLTGMTAPTEGSAVVNGWRLENNGISNIRQNLGYCPQFDMLFDFMTVQEHLEMFASLKSSETSKTQSYDVEDMMHSIGLWSVRHELVGTLSGGMQRRLSVAIAFIGNSKVIILDEPTSSIDPNGRRAIWDMILKNRAGKTIILCTHHLDEADTLGDRIAIIDNGKLRAEGSPMSLKKEHASGYQLFLEKMPTSQTGEHDVSAVTQFITQICPSAVLMSDIGSSLTYSLPSAELPRFDSLFTELDGNLTELGISGFGISDSTLDEVFEKITDEDTTESASSGANNSTHDFGSSSNASCSGILSSLFRKRFLHTIKDLKTYFSLIVLPCAFIALALGVTLLVPDRTNQPSLELQPSLYPNTYSFYNEGDQSEDALAMTSTLFADPGVSTACINSLSEPPANNHFSCDGKIEMEAEASPTLQSLPVCSCSGKSLYTCEGDNPELDTFVTGTGDKLVHIKDSYSNIQDYLLATYNYYKAARYGGWTFESEAENKTSATVWFDNRAFHSSPSYLNALSNMIVRAAVKENGLSESEYGITVYNHPLLLSPGQLSVKNALEKTADLGVSLTFLVAFTFIPAGLCIYLVLEHIKGEKHLQYVYGVGPIRYWLVTFLWDMLMFILPISLCLLLMYLFGIRAYTVGDNLLAVFILLVGYAWAVLPFMYTTIRLFKSTTTAFFSLLMVNLFIGISLSTLVFLFNFFKFTNGPTGAYEFTRLFFLIFPQYSFTSALIQLNVNQALVDLLDRFDENLYTQYHPFNEANGIVWNLVSLAIQGVVFFIITLLIDLKSSNCGERISKKHKKQGELDSDVVDETRRVHSSPREDVLAVKGLSKQYRMHNLRHVLAVNDLSFGVRPGEIFGLCGVNGAGKTTAFKMLTGEVLPTEGSASLHQRPVTNSKSRRLIGYCPQVNSLDALLTGREMLHVYAQLKNISDPVQAVDNIIQSFGMKKYIEKQVKSLSGGMKRNLCVSIALLGNPDVVFLDEPSAGMDPVARRTVWNQVLAAAARGCAVVLTSHSMTECEALCHRIGIMLNGKLACLGSSQHLKNKFGLGYTMKVKVAGPLPHITRVVNFIKSTWPQSEVKDQHLNTIEFSIPHTGGQTLASLFSLIEKQKGDLYIDEYSVFQTTLDQVFIQFARNQQDQIDDSSDGDSHSMDTESSTRYTNGAYAGVTESMTLSEDGKAVKTLQNLDGDQSWNTYL